MIEFIIGSIFGFVAGCTLKEFIKAKIVSYGKENECESSNTTMQPMDGRFFTINPSGDNAQCDDKGFNLSTIRALFDKYDVKLVSENSFLILLNKIERTTYKNTLKMFSASVSSPGELIDLLEHGKTIDEKINPQICNDEVIIFDLYVDKLLKAQEVDCSSVNRLEDKIQLFISFYISKGLKRFKKTMGPSLEQFVSDYEAGKDVSILYNEIMKNIKEALSFISQN